MPDIYETSQAYRAALLDREKKAALRLIRAYGLIWKRLERRLRPLTDRIEAARAAGEDFSHAWLLRQERLRELMDQIVREMSRFADLVNGEITAEQRRAIAAALKDSGSLIQSSVTVSFNRLPAAAVESMVGFLADGSPLTRLLGELPGTAAREVSAALQEAVALGYNPRKTARSIREALGGNLTRALRISRTETLRAYREATLQSYRANSDIIEGWYWLASLSRRTCAACIAMHGTFHSLNERMASHVQCRCTQIPGIKGNPPPIEPGAKWFKKQKAEIQRAILNSEAEYQAIKSGELKITDLVGRRESPQWGANYHHLGLKRALAGEGRFPGYEQAVGATG